MKEIPFTCSPEVEEKIENFLKFDHEEIEPALVVAFGGEIHDPNGKLMEKIEGIHFILGRYNKGDRPKESFHDFNGKRISIMQPTLEHLRGKRLVMKKPSWSKWKLFKRRKLLRAEPIT